MHRMYRNHGFTLIELLIAVAIIGIISAIAIPMYGGYVQRSKISEAVATLSDTRVKMEQYFLDNRTYEGACDTNNPHTTNVPLPTGKYFNFQCVLNPTTYQIVATGRDDANMTGFTYTIDQSNTKQTTNLPSGWNGTNNNTTINNCWVLKSDGSC